MYVRYVNENRCISINESKKVILNSYDNKKVIALETGIALNCEKLW